MTTMTTSSANILSLPDDLIIHIFTFLDLSDINRCFCTRKSWNQIQRQNELWNHLLVRPKMFTEVSTDDIARLKSLGIFSSPRTLFYHLRTLDQKLWSERSGERHANRVTHFATLYRTPPPHLSNGLIPLMTMDANQRVQDVAFVTQWHVLGLIGYLLPCLGGWFGPKIGIICTCLGMLLRAITYCAYFDEEKREPRNERWFAVWRCMLWGLFVTGLIFLVKLLVRSYIDNLWNQDSRSSTDHSDFEIELPTVAVPLTFATHAFRVGNLPLRIPSFWR
eukprot:TRINITY_DN2113_c0_g1_i1.p1 TRINITY_DN2113_c0_g1~~TRINITY_DN2113_c0_g1_i1.p1  ORF type:complete len:278 (-),score=26.27 TRINITY_DN2113_c0_g1_i1:432-1265(-)